MVYCFRKFTVTTFVPFWLVVPSARCRLTCPGWPVQDDPSWLFCPFYSVRLFYPAVCYPGYPAAIVLSWLLYIVFPVLSAVFLSSCPCYHDLAILPSMSCPDWPVRQTCPDRTIHAVLSRLSCPSFTVPVCCPRCPVAYVLSRMSCPSCTVMVTILARFSSPLSCPRCPVPAVRSQLSSPCSQLPTIPVMAVLTRLFSPVVVLPGGTGPPVLPALLALALTCPCSCCRVTILSYLSSPGCPVLTILFRSPGPTVVPHLS